MNTLSILDRIIQVRYILQSINNAPLGKIGLIDLDHTYYFFLILSPSVDPRSVFQVPKPTEKKKCNKDLVHVRIFSVNINVK